MFNKNRALLIALLTLTLSLTLFSDDFFKVKEKVLNDSRLKLGFIYLTPLLMLDNVGYTSSIYTYDAEEHPDWTGDVGIGLRASAILANRFILQAEDLPHYSFYLENKQLRTWSNQFASTAYSHAGPFNLKAGFKLNDLYQRPQLEFSRPYHYRDSEWSGEIDIGRRYNLFLTLFASTNKLEYDDEPYLGGYDLSERLNHRQNTFGFKLNKPIFTSTTVYLGYERVEYQFEQSPERNANAHQLALGVEFPEMSSLQGSFQIGLRRFEPINPSYKGSQTATGRGDVRLTLADRVRLKVFYEIARRFSYYSTDVFYDDHTFGGGIDTYLTRFLKVGWTYRDGRLKYRSFIDLELQRSDRIRNQQYFIAVPFFGNTSLGFAYNVYRLTSDALDLDYSRSYWGAFLQYGF